MTTADPRFTKDEIDDIRYCIAMTELKYNDLPVRVTSVAKLAKIAGFDADEVMDEFVGNAHRSMPQIVEFPHTHGEGAVA